MRCEIFAVVVSRRGDVEVSLGQVRSTPSTASNRIAPWWRVRHHPLVFACYRTKVWERLGEQRLHEEAKTQQN
jgi:hypothetical protein